MGGAALMSIVTQLQHEFYDRLMESQYQAPEQRRTAQIQQLEKLARHARKHVPFYEERLNVLFGTGGAFNFERWLDVPILTRHDLL